MHDRNREFLVGLVFLGLMGLLAAVTLRLADLDLGGPPPETFRFDGVAGLTEGSEVWINGVPSGIVETVEVLPDGSVQARADMRTDLSGLDLRSDATVEVRSKSALGGSVIAIGTGSAPEKGALATLRQRLWSAVPDPLASVGDTLGRVGPRIETMVDSATKVLDDIGERSGKVMENLDALTSDLRTVTAELREGKGTLGRLLKDDALHDRLLSAVDRADALLAQVQKGEGTLGRLASDRAMADDLAATIKDLRAISGRLERGEGSLGKLLREDALHDDLAAAVRDLRETTADLRAGKGLLGRLVHDEELADTTSATLRDLNAIVADVRAGKGTLGRLVTDDSLHGELEAALRSIRRSSEEARENAPILTFAGFLFNTF